MDVFHLRNICAFAGLLFCSALVGEEVAVDNKAEPQQKVDAATAQQEIASARPGSLGDSLGANVPENLNPSGVLKIRTSSEKMDQVADELHQISEKNINGEMQGKNPPTRKHPEKNEVSIALSPLFWVGYNGFVFAAEYIAPAETPAGLTSVNRRIFEVNYDWHPGARVALGWNSNFDAWDVNAIWTYIHIADHRNITAPVYDVSNSVRLAIIRPSGYGNATNGYYPYAKGFWRLNYNTGDLELKRSFFLSKAFACRPILSIKGASLRQSYRSVFYGAAEFGEDNYLDTKIKNSSKYWGVGPRFGVDGKYYFCKSFGLSGLVTGALLFGKEVEWGKTYQITPNTPGLPNIGQWALVGTDHYSYWMLAPTLQIMLGFDWGISIGRLGYFGINASWEMNYWWNQLHYDADVLISRAVELQGATVTLEARF